MSTRPLRLTGLAAGSHVEVISAARDSLNDTGGSIVDFHMFSNAILCLNFEIAASRLPALRAALADSGVRLDDRSLEALDSASSGAAAAREKAGATVGGTLSINIINDEPPLRIEIPAVPG